MEALFTTVGTFDVSSAMLLYLLWLSLLFFCRTRLARQRNRRLGNQLCHAPAEFAVSAKITRWMDA